MFEKSKVPIGLDISDLSLKAIQLNKKGEKLEISGAGKYYLKPGIIKNGEILNIEEFSNSVHQMLSKPFFGSFAGNEVVTCLPDTKTFIKLIEIEKSPNKLNLQIGLELEKNIPFNKNEIYYDWQLIGKKDDTSEVLIAASPKNLVEHYIEALKRSKLQVVALEAEPIAIARSLLAEESPKKTNSREKNYCIIDIGAKKTSLTIYSKNTIVSSVSLPISGDETTDLIAGSLEIKKEEAEKAKIICGLDKAQAHGIVAGILSEMVDLLAQKIEQTVNFFYKHCPDRGEINQIILCGGGSNIKLLGNTISDYTGIESNAGNPFVNLNISEEEIGKIFAEKHKMDTSKLEKFDDDFLVHRQNSALSYPTAIGLALRNCFITKI